VKKLMIILVAPFMAGCAAVPLATTVLSQAVAVADKVEVPAKQALLVADNAYQAAAATATGAMIACSKTPTLSPCVALTRKADQIVALSALAKGKLLQAHQGVNVAANAAEVMNIVSSITSLTGK
jgi:hypothetical protein